MECEKKEYQLQAVCFAAATGVVIACLEGTIVKSFVVQLRVWMFLALNLLLLAILFTSTNPTLLSAKSVQKQSNASDEKLKAAEEEEEDCKVEIVCIENEENQDYYKKEKIAESELMGQPENIEKIIQCDLKPQGNGEVEMKEEYFQLSKEELNEKVEAFITMFKQHLRSDAKGRTCRQLHSSLSKNSRRITVMPKHFR